MSLKAVIQITCLATMMQAAGPCEVFLFLAVIALSPFSLSNQRACLNHEIC